MVNKLEILEKIAKCATIFNLFEKIYVFGSILISNKPSNDIDLLFVYKGRSLRDISTEKNYIVSFLQSLFGMPIDITILSEKELQQTAFLDKINYKYKTIK